MNAIYTECSIALNDCNPIFGEHRIIIRIDDQAEGPYLVIRGVNDAPDLDETPHDFFLCTEGEIDKFADICKAMLRQAEPAPVAVISGDNNQASLEDEVM